MPTAAAESKASTEKDVKSTLFDSIAGEVLPPAITDALDDTIENDTALTSAAEVAFDDTVPPPATISPEGASAESNASEATTSISDAIPDGDAESSDTKETNSKPASLDGLKSNTSPPPEITKPPTGPGYTDQL